MWVTDGNRDARTGSQDPQNTGNGPGGSENLQGAPGACGEFPSMESPGGLHGGGREGRAGEPPGVAAVNEDTHAVWGVYWEALSSAKARLWRTSTHHMAF